jgi:hypothetical protein
MNYLLILLIFVPVALFSRYLGGPAALTFGAGDHSLGGVDG